MAKVSARGVESGAEGDRGPARDRKHQRRILVVDDHAVVREGLVQRINREPDMVVCGEAGNARDALAVIEKCLPDLVLLDISLPGRSGLELIKDFRSSHAGIPVLVLSMHDEAVFGERVLRAGGRGYVSKAEDATKVLVAIRRVLGGGVYLSETVSSLMLGSLGGSAKGVAPSPVNRLTDREFEVLALIGRALGPADIAERLGMSTKTVDAHRANIKRKLGLASGPELVRYAVLWAESAH